MKKSRKPQPFNWSRKPSSEQISGVYFADPSAYTSFGKSITKDEFCSSLDVYNRITALEQKKQFFRNMFFGTLILIPFVFFFYNIFIGVSR